LSDKPQPDFTQVRLLDILLAVSYLKSIGADSASENFVRNLISTGQIPHVRIGKKFYISRVALDSWINSRERKSR
jgi:excisionase family DNA binding protein